MEVSIEAINKSIRPRIIGALFAAQSLFSAATIVSFTLTAIIAADLSGSDSVAGLPSTLTLAGRALLAYPIGWLLDRIGRRLGLSLGYLLGLVGVLVSAVSIMNGSFFGFLAGSLLIGGSRASSEQSRYVAAEVYPADRQSKAIGLIVFAGTVGAIGGPLLVEMSADTAEGMGFNYYAGPFILASLFLLIAAGIVFVLLHPDPQQIGLRIAELTAAKKVMAEKTLAGPAGESAISFDLPDSMAEKQSRPIRQIFSHPLPRLAVLSMTVGQLVMAMLMVITALHMDHNGHDTGSISLVIMAHTLGMFGLSGVTGWLVEQVGRRIMIAAGSVILLVSCVLAPISTGVPLLALALFLLGLGWNFCFVAGSSLLSAQLEAAERGRAQGAGDVAVAIGAGAGSLGSGFIFAWGGIFAVSLVGGAFSLALFVTVLWMMVARQPVKSLATGHD